MNNQMPEHIVHRDLDLSLLMKGVCARPRMYIGSDENFRMIAAFIDGFAYASETFSEEIREFSFWIGTKFQLPRNVAWFCNLEKVYPDFEETIAKLPELFEEFRKDKKNGWSFASEFDREMKRIEDEGNNHP